MLIIFFLINDKNILYNDYVKVKKINLYILLKFHPESQLHAFLNKIKIADSF